MPSLGHVDTPGVCIGLQPSACAVQEGREELMVQAYFSRVQVVCFSIFYNLFHYSLFVPQQLHIKCGRMQSAIVGRRDRLKSQKFWVQDLMARKSVAASRVLKGWQKESFKIWKVLAPLLVLLYKGVTVFFRFIPDLCQSIGLLYKVLDSSSPFFQSEQKSKRPSLQQVEPCLWDCQLSDSQGCPGLKNMWQYCL